VEPEAREAGEVLVRFFCARLRLHSLSRLCISLWDTDSSVRTTASNFSDSDFIVDLGSDVEANSRMNIGSIFSAESPQSRSNILKIINGRIFMCVRHLVWYFIKPFGIAMRARCADGEQLFSREKNFQMTFRAFNFHSRNIPEFN
jgi:hypothetical protein